MSSVRLALAFLLLFLAGYFVGSNHPGNWIKSIARYTSEYSLWRPELIWPVLASTLSLSGIYFLLLVIGERFAALETERARHQSPFRETTSAEEYLRRRGSF